MPRIKERRVEEGLTQNELAKSINKDVPLLSKFENYVCLPTPEDATKLADVLNCKILELYNEDELRFLDRCCPTKKKDRAELLVYRLTADLPRDAINWLNNENLKMLGYLSIRDWVTDCSNKFKKRFKRKRANRTAIQRLKRRIALPKLFAKIITKKNKKVK